MCSIVSTRRKSPVSGDIFFDRLQGTGRGLQATSRRLQVAGRRSQTAVCSLQVTAYCLLASPCILVSLSPCLLAIVSSCHRVIVSPVTFYIRGTSVIRQTQARSLHFVIAILLIPLVTGAWQPGLAARQPLGTAPA